MPDFCRWRLVVVVLAVEVGYGCVNELVDIDAFETDNSDGVELATKRRILSPSKRANTAMLAEYMMDTIGTIVDEVSFACGQPKVVRSYDSSPQPCHGAHWAVALEGARTQIEVRFKANSTAVAASFICLFHMPIGM
jgi:hypothetical protein